MGPNLKHHRFLAGHSSFVMDYLKILLNLYKMRKKKLNLLKKKKIVYLHCLDLTINKALPELHLNCYLDRWV